MLIAPPDIADPSLCASPPPAFADRRQFLGQPARASACSPWPACSIRQGLLADGRREAPADRPSTRWRRGRRTSPAKAKSVIWLFMNGGPSQVDTWDYKPELEKRDGQELQGLRQEHRLLHRPGRAADEVAVQVRAARPVRASGCRRSSRTWPKHVDKMAFIHSCWTESNNHSPALFKINTGMTPHGLPVRRLVGDLRPGQREPEPAGVRRHVRHARPRAAQGPRQNWGAGFLPSVYQGTALKPQGDPIDNLDRPPDMTADAAARPARPPEPAQQHAPGAAPRRGRPRGPRSRAFELAYRMQMAAPEALDLDREPERVAEALRPRQPEVHPLRQAVPDRPAAGRARRAVRADLFAAAWRTSGAGTATPTSPSNHGGFAAETDQPIAGLLADLKRTRPAGRHAGDLGRRVRPAADRAARGQNRAATTTRTPSPSGWPAAASRAASTTARPTRSATRRSTTASASTTCTPRSCTCWAWTTRS